VFPNMIGILSAIFSALAWGSGDFAGGLATRRSTSTHVLLIGSLAGFILYVPAGILRREPFPGLDAIVWSALAGLSGGIGLVIFYRALSIGPMSLVAPTAGVVGASAPVLVALVVEGFPNPSQFAGLLLGLAGIWLVSTGQDRDLTSSISPPAYAIASGICFGGFFIFIGQVAPGLLFGPLAIVKLSASALAAMLLLARKRMIRLRDLHPLPIAAGVLDAVGAVFFLLATQFARLDIAAVISSMYPGATVILARAIQREHMSRLQPLGIGICLAAVAMIAAG
jgi:drug/metabolite transporter (DMT)-like permease